MPNPDDLQRLHERARQIHERAKEQGRELLPEEKQELAEISVRLAGGDEDDVTALRQLAAEAERQKSEVGDQTERQEMSIDYGQISNKFLEFLYQFGYGSSPALGHNRLLIDVIHVGHDLLKLFRPLVRPLGPTAHNVN